MSSRSREASVGICHLGNDAGLAAVKVDPDRAAPCGMTPWGYARCDDTVGYARCDDTVGYARCDDTVGLRPAG